MTRFWKMLRDWFRQPRRVHAHGCADARPGYEHVHGPCRDWSGQALTEDR